MSSSGHFVKRVPDPFQVKEGQPPADIILITHPHYDHCSPVDVKKLLSPGTVIVCDPDSATKLKGNVRSMKPGDRITVSGVSIEAVPSYNVDKAFHAKREGWIGFIFTVGGVRIYLAGDTDHIPEMKSFRDIDIALLPVSGVYVMGPEDAVKAALDIKPKTAIPMHYNTIVGTRSDAERFAAGLKDKVDVLILEAE